MPAEQPAELPSKNSAAEPTKQTKKLTLEQPARLPSKTLATQPAAQQAKLRVGEPAEMPPKESATEPAAQPAKPPPKQPAGLPTKTTAEDPAEQPEKLPPEQQQQPPGTEPAAELVALAAEQPGAKTQEEQLEKLPPEGLPPEKLAEESTERPEKLLLEQPAEWPGKSPLSQQQTGEASWTTKCERKDATNCGAPKSKTEYSERVIFGLEMTQRQAINDVPGEGIKIKHDSPKSKIPSFQTYWTGCLAVPCKTPKISTRGVLRSQIDWVGCAPVTDAMCKISQDRTVPRVTKIKKSAI